MDTDYIGSLRKIVGHRPIILTFAGGVLVNENNEILLQRRVEFEGWGLPGGAIEFGETAAEACKREYFEETGFKVAVVSLLGVTSSHIQKYPNGDVAQAIVIAFVLRLIGGQMDLTSDETKDLGYFSQDNLPSIFNEQHRDSIEQFFAKNIPYFD